MDKLNFFEMQAIAGGISREEYCKQLGTIMANCELDEGAHAGAQYAWNKYCA